MTSTTPPSLQQAPANPPLPKPSRWSRFRNYSSFPIYAGLTFAGSLCALAAPLMPYSTNVLRLFVDLASHFVWAYLVIAIILSAVGQRWARWFSLATIPICLMVLAGAYAAGERPTPGPNGQPSLRVLSVNVFAGNKNSGKLMKFLDARQPDVVIVQEVTPAWATVLENLEAYPHRKIIPRNDSFGIALLSKHPLKNVLVLDETEFDRPAIAAEMLWQGRTVNLVAVHPLPPINPRAYADRNTILSRHAIVLKASDQPAVMAGDFNATPWSAGLSVVQDAGMVRATSLAPTWPAHLVTPAVIPIDQIVVSKHWGVESAQRGPDVGSDHFPVEATLYLK